MKTMKKTLTATYFAGTDGTGKNLRKRIRSLFSIVLIAAEIMMTTLISAGLPQNQAYASTNGKNANQAISWVKSQCGRALDYDGVYGAQCVDLIAYYYRYLGQTTPGGNGVDYSWNALPAGWKRIRNARPQKGDILVYSGNASNPYGHVAIYESDYSTYHQNFNNRHYVQHVTYRYSRLGNRYWGVIRPDWNRSFGLAAFTSVESASNIARTSAKLTAHIPYQQISACGVYVGTSTSNMRCMGWDGAGRVQNMWYTVTGLRSRTTYYYKFFYQKNGQTKWSPIRSFRTR